MENEKINMYDSICCNENEMCNYESSMCPIYEKPIQKCINKDYIHEVPHVCPINTKIINRHIYKHTYRPCYTCTSENICCNINEGSCCDF